MPLVKVSRNLLNLPQHHHPHKNNNQKKSQQIRLLLLRKSLSQHQHQLQLRLQPRLQHLHQLLHLLQPQRQPKIHNQPQQQNLITTRQLNFPMASVRIQRSISMLTAMCLNKNTTMAILKPFLIMIKRQLTKSRDITARQQLSTKL